jgi:hypothetical protein
MTSNKQFQTHTYKPIFHFIIAKVSHLTHIHTLTPINSAHDNNSPKLPQTTMQKHTHTTRTRTLIHYISYSSFNQMIILNR